MSYRKRSFVESGIFAALLINAIVLVSGPASADTLYAVAPFNSSFDNSAFYSIDTITGVQTTVSDNTGVSFLNSLARSPSGVLYSQGGDTFNQLATINPMTGAATAVQTITLDVQPGDPTTARGMAFDAAGNLYATYASSDLFSDLYRINTTTGAATRIGSTGLNVLQALAFSPSGTLYGHGVGTGLVTIDTATGAATHIGTVDSAVSIQSLAFAPGGVLWGVAESPLGGDSGELYTIDPITGALTLKFDHGIAQFIGGIEFAQPVPVPAAIWLFGSGLAAMAGLARRKSVEL